MDWGPHPSHINSYKWVSHGEKKGFSHYMPYDSIGSDLYEPLIAEIMIAAIPDPFRSIDSFHENIMSKY